MAKCSNYFLCLAWLSYLFISGVLLFSRGFLLTRQALPNNSTCDEEEICKGYRETPDIKRELYLDCLERDRLRLWPRNDFRHTCQGPSRKILFFVVDALRYDFLAHDPSIEDKDRLPYQNRMVKLNNRLKQFPQNTRLLKFIANPPTTTLQRLKGMTTGSLPTFIDAGLNFGAPEISEDNLLDQLRKFGGKIVMMGDDVWTHLFPSRFLRQFPYPSFNIFDLDTVDNGILDRFFGEYYKNDWNMMVVHFLGVDHCGHAFGPNHSEMTRKLNQLDEFFGNVIDNLHNDGMVFILGDHGMTSNGDHGGDTDDEVTAGLFVYSTDPLMPEILSNNSAMIHQVDLVPTLAYLTGVSIPFANIGKMALSLIPASKSNDTADFSVSLATEALVANIEQIMLYINTYSRRTHLFSKEKINSIAHKFHDLRDDLEHVRDTKSFLMFRNKSMKFLNYVRTLFEEIWVQFDSFLMSRGLVLTFLLLTFTFIIVEGIPADTMAGVLSNGFLKWAYGVSFLCACVSGSLKVYQIIDDGFLLNCVTALTLSVFLLAVTVVQNWKCITHMGVDLYKTRDWLSFYPRIFFLCSLLLFFSNSFVVEEARVLLFLIVTCVFAIASSMKSIGEVSGRSRKDDKFPWMKILGQPKIRVILFSILFSAILRTSAVFWKCREEQAWCMDSPKSLFRGLDTLATLAFLALFTVAIRMWLRSCGNLVGFLPAVAVARYGPSVIIVCTGGLWVIQGIPRDTKFKLLVPWQQQLFPWAAYFFVVVGLLTMVFRPVCVYVVQKRTDCLSIYGRENIIPQLFHQVRQVMGKATEPADRKVDTPLVYGLATSYSAAFIILAEYLCLLLFILLGETTAVSAVLLFTTVFCLLALLSYIRLETSISALELFHIPTSYVICWGMMSAYFFYGTGHQATFTAIPWHAAFVGTDGQFTNNFIPMILIGFNAFCSQALMGLMLPMLLIAPFTLFIMLPKWLPLSVDREGWKENLYKDLKQGEIFLFERGAALQYAAFKLSAKYMLFHATRVLACMLAAAFHCRHLMVWKIFAPRFIFEGIGFFVTIAFTLFGYLFLARVSSQIDTLLSSIMKKKG